MTADATANLVFFGLVLVPPVAALIAWPVPVPRMLGMLLVWRETFVAGLLVFGERARFDPYLARAAALLHLDDQHLVGKEVRIRMAADGHFWARVSIAGVSRRMLIDSGATVTAVSTATAEDAGLAVHQPTFPMILKTANGSIAAQVATVDTLRLGDVVARDLPVVVSPAFGDTDVLGMNFLSKLKSWRVEGQTLILTPHHPQKSFT